MFSWLLNWSSVVLTFAVYATVCALADAAGISTAPQASKAKASDEMMRGPKRPRTVGMVVMAFIGLMSLGSDFSELRLLAAFIGFGLSLSLLFDFRGGIL
jgi:hypothetical protein